MSVEELIEGADTYTSLAEVADAPQTEEPGATWVPVVISMTAFADC